MSRPVRVQAMKPSLLVLIRLNDMSRASIAAAFDVTYAPDPASRAAAIAEHGGDLPRGADQRYDRRDEC